MGLENEFEENPVDKQEDITRRPKLLEAPGKRRKIPKVSKVFYGSSTPRLVEQPGYARFRRITHDRYGRCPE